MADDDEPHAAPAHRPLVGGAAMGAVSRASVAVTGAATTIVVARLLGPSGAGGFAIALTVIYVLNVFTTFGIEHGVAYYVSQGRWNPRHAFRAVTRMAAVVGTVTGLLTVAIRVLFPAPFGDLTVAETACAAFAVPFVLAWMYCSFIALAVDHYEGYVLPPAIQSASALVLAVGLGLAFDLPGMIVGLLLSHVLAAAVTVLWLRRRLSRTPEAPHEPGHFRRALRFGIKGYASNALQVLNYRVSVFVLAATASTAVVGQFSVAVGATSVLWLLPQAVSDVLFPRVAALSASEHGDAEAQRDFAIAKSLRHTTLIVLVGGIVFAVALWLLVVPVYGADFEPAIDLGLILVPGVCLLGVAGVLSAVIVGRGKPEYGLYSALIVTPLTIVLYVVLIPALAATGAAIATSTSFVVSFALAWFFFHRITATHVFPLMIPTRDELDDYRRLWPQVRAWRAGRRAEAAR